MDAAQLVEQRKAGSITQEQFFIALNKLRRANSGLDSTRPPSLSTTTTTTTTETAAAAPPNAEIVGEAENDETQRGGPDLCSFRPTSAAMDGMSDGSIRRPKVVPHNDTHQKPEPRPSAIAVPGTQTETDADGTSIDVASQRFGGPRRENHVQLIGRGDPARHNTPHESTRSISPRKHAVTSPTGGRGRERLLSPDGDEQANEVQRREESEWLVSPRGETQSRLLTRKMPGDQKHSGSRHAFVSNGQGSVLRGESAARGLTSPLKNGGDTESNRVMKAQWRPAGGGGSSQPCWQQGNLVQPGGKSTPVASPLSPSAITRMVLSAAAITRSDEPGDDGGDQRRPVDDSLPRRIRGTRAQQSSAVRSILEKARQRRVVTSSGVGRRRRGLSTQQQDSSAGSTAEGALSSTNIFHDASQQHTWSGVRSCSKTGEDASTSSLPPDDSHRRRYRPSREKEGTAPRAAATRRQLSGSASVGGLDCQDRAFSARCDRYGYPLHETEGLGSSRGAGGGRSLFSPRIKGLPAFYRSRPRINTTESSQVNFERAGGGGASQPNSVYERTTRWLAQSGDLRALKMAQREEQEMDACTFQPNTPRRHSSTSSRSGAVESLSLLSYAAGGGCGNEEGSTENSSKRPPASEGGGKGKDSDFSRSVGAVGLRLFEESKRLRERRFEGEERKRMGEEEAYARTCTFKPSLVQGSAARSMDVRARYMDASPTLAAPVQEDVDQPCTFRPKIVGVQPGMTRAREYVGMDVSERLYRARPNRQQRPVAYFRGGVGGHEEEGRGHYPCPSEVWDDEKGHHDRGFSVHDKAGDALKSPQSEGLGDSGRRFDGGFFRDTSRDCEYFGKQDNQRRLSEGYRGGNSARGTEVPSRPCSAPAAGRERADWGHPPGELSARDAAGGAEGGPILRERAERGEREKVKRRGREYSCGDGGGGAVRGGPRRQTAISFREFLARQAHSQATARQRLGRLTRMQSPSFTPLLSRGSRRIVERNSAGGAGGGCFEDRLKVTARRRQRNRKAAVSAARLVEQKGCTFSPELTVLSRVARSRSARELSIGDSTLRAAKQRMARAREEIRLLGDPAGADGGFTPRLETAGDNMAPPSSSRLRLADELDTYIDRIQDAAMDREEILFQRRRRALAEEAQLCPFQPMVKKCPDLVRRTAAGMRCIREFRRNEALSIGGPTRPAKPGWR